MSTRDHRRYTRSEQAKEDQHQLVFCESGLKANPNIVKIAHDTLLPLDKLVACPFCLGLSEFRKFLVSLKTGISRSMGKCPLCGRGMMLKTLKLMSEANASDYAKFVFGYHGFCIK